MSVRIERSSSQQTTSPSIANLPSTLTKCIIPIKATVVKQTGSLNGFVYGALYQIKTDSCDDFIQQNRIRMHVYIIIYANEWNNKL